MRAACFVIGSEAVSTRKTGQIDQKANERIEDYLKDGNCLKRIRMKKVVACQWDQIRSAVVNRVRQLGYHGEVNVQLVESNKEVWKKCRATWSVDVCGEQVRVESSDGCGKFLRESSTDILWSDAVRAKRC